MELNALGTEEIGKYEEYPSTRKFKGSTEPSGEIKFPQRVHTELFKDSGTFRVMKKGYTKSCWGPEQSSAWNSLLSSLDKKLSLEHPVTDLDASTVGIGGILLQRATSGKEKLINLFSRKFNKTDTRWSTIEQEAFGGNRSLKSSSHLQKRSPETCALENDDDSFYLSYQAHCSENQTADFLSRIELKNDYSSKTRKIRTLKALDTTTKGPEKDVLLKQIHLELGHASAGLVVKVLRDRG
ncbi:hypothetical protein ADUPG1_006377 [Aduncisulcus paluster]|uniref:Reverse transcriptase/retrotransposon-derived protein RNase H-like domain-containing protein n=1 Tax=Aduncisulcus paluster TaxID=2918883 RepID=A0ABQ5KML7_9EUKA|nr:hypothetical protein ADUPG1_006377 [Aduncisulcus paluster]